MLVLESVKTTECTSYSHETSSGAYQLAATPWNWREKVNDNDLAHTCPSIFRSQSAEDC